MDNEQKEWTFYPRVINIGKTAKGIIIPQNIIELSGIDKGDKLKMITTVERKNEDEKEDVQVKRSTGRSD